MKTSTVNSQWRCAILKKDSERFRQKRHSIFLNIKFQYYKDVTFSSAVARVCAAQGRPSIRCPPNYLNMLTYLNRKFK